MPTTTLWIWPSSPSSGMRRSEKPWPFCPLRMSSVSTRIEPGARRNLPACHVTPIACGCSASTFQRSEQSTPPPIVNSFSSGRLAGTISRAHHFARLNARRSPLAQTSVTSSPLGTTLPSHVISRPVFASRIVRLSALSFTTSKSAPGIEIRSPSAIVQRSVKRDSYIVVVSSTRLFCDLLPKNHWPPRLTTTRCSAAAPRELLRCPSSR